MSKKRSDVTADEEWMTAIHEAGHTIAHVRLQPESYMLDVTIVPDGENAGCGRYEELTSEDSSRWNKEAVELCAGYAAQILFGGNENDARLGSASDLDKVAEMVTGWNLAPMQDHIAAAVNLLDRHENRTASGESCERIGRYASAVWRAS
jgi:ATP-dependent Zn protease